MRYEGIERQIYSDTYNLFVRVCSGDGSDLYWENVLAESKELLARYKGYEFVEDILAVLLKQLEFKVGQRLDKYGKTYVEYTSLLNEIANRDK